MSDVPHGRPVPHEPLDGREEPEELGPTRDPGRPGRPGHQDAQPEGVRPPEVATEGFSNRAGRGGTGSPGRAPLGATDSEPQEDRRTRAQKPREPATDRGEVGIPQRPEAGVGAVEGCLGRETRKLPGGAPLEAQAPLRDSQTRRKRPGPFDALLRRVHGVDLDTLAREECGVLAQAALEVQHP